VDGKHATAAPSRHLQKGIPLRSRRQGINFTHPPPTTHHPPTTQSTTAVDFSAAHKDRHQRPIVRPLLFHPNNSLPRQFSSLLPPRIAPCIRLDAPLPDVDFTTFLSSAYVASSFSISSIPIAVIYRHGRTSEHAPSPRYWVG
jgi:hypothetical protein